MLRYSVSQDIWTFFSLSLVLITLALQRSCLYSLDQVYPVVDGGPVEECYVFFVWLPNVEARLHQLSAALKDAVPGDEGQIVKVKKNSCLQIAIAEPKSIIIYLLWMLQSIG